MRQIIIELITAAMTKDYDTSVLCAESTWAQLILPQKATTRLPHGLRQCDPFTTQVGITVKKQNTSSFPTCAKNNAHRKSEKTVN